MKNRLEGTRELKDIRQEGFAFASEVLILTEIDGEDEGNLMIRNLFGAKGYDLMMYIFGTLLII